MRVLGHRGAPWEAPENTLESFAAAQALGADGVELDVRLCATGEVVVCHDVTLERFTGAAARVRAVSWTALGRYDLGLGTRVPTLDAVLDLFAAGGLVNVEVKTDDVDLAALVAGVAAVLDRHPRTEVVVSSFEPRALVALRALRPKVPRGMLLAPAAAGHVVGTAAQAAVAPHAIHPWHGDATPARVAWWRRLGLAVNVWTVDDPEEARALEASGATTIISNVPGSVRGQA